MQIKVGQIGEHFASRREATATFKLGELAVSPDGVWLTVPSAPSCRWALDDATLKLLGQYLKVPSRYLQGIDPDFRVTLLTYELERHAFVDTAFESVDDHLVAVHSPSQVMIPLNEVLRVVEKVFDPEDTVRRLIADGERLHIDVTTAEKSLTIPPAKAPDPEVSGDGEPWIDSSELEGLRVDMRSAIVADSELRPALPPALAVGDITEAGVRFLATPFRSTPPSVNLYAERLVCTNGMTTDARLGRIAIRGNTLEEVIAEMEIAAETILGSLDEYLIKLAGTRTMPVPGSAAAFAAQLAREANVSRAVLDAVLDILNQLPEPVSIWDVNQAFTSVANRTERYATMVRLQTLGGALAFDAPRMMERCGSCERLL